MRVTAPLASARIGDIEILGVQQVVELEALEVSPEPNRADHLPNSQNTTQSVTPSAINTIQSKTAIVVPCKDEPLDHIRGVWAAIPASSLIILVSGSNFKNYAAERDALAVFCQTTGRSGMAIHQRDPKVADALRVAGMKELLDSDGDGLVYKGKGEGLVLGIALAATARGPRTASHASVKRRGPAVMLDDTGCGGGCKLSSSHDNGPLPCSNSISAHGGNSHSCCRTRSSPRYTNGDRFDGVPGYYKYIGFVDADNFVPGSVQEYCRAFSAGLHLAQAEDAMVRVNWSSKPKVDNGKLHFKPTGRSSEIVNRWLNRLLKTMDACIDTVDARGQDEVADLICTGNAGEHAMTISLALKLRVASGYAIEPFHFLDIFERFAGEPKSSRGEEPAITVLPESSTMLTANFGDDLPMSPASMSPVDSPSGTPLESSPLLSACEESTQPTSPSITSASFGKVPAVKQLPPPLNTYCQAVRAPTNAMAGMTPPISPISQASPAKVQILQIRTINPHFHDNKGDEHVKRMWKQGLSAIFHSPVVSSLTEYREDLRMTTFDGGDNESQGTPTPPFSSGASVATSSSLSVDETVDEAVVIAAPEWQPARCRIYPTTGSMNLEELRTRLENNNGSFWWSGKEGRGSGKQITEKEGACTIGSCFDDVAILGLGPVSREKRPEGDVDGFKACVDRSH